MTAAAGAKQEVGSGIGLAPPRQWREQGQQLDDALHRREGRDIDGHHFHRHRDDLAAGGYDDAERWWDAVVESAPGAKRPLGTETAGSARAVVEHVAQVAAALTHPHIVPVYDYGEHEGQPVGAVRDEPDKNGGIGLPLP